MKDIVCWWSGGITSAVACKTAIEIYGKDRCRVIMIDTYNEHEDTYRFKNDCQAWYGLNIETISSERFKSIQEVWVHYKALNHATGAICSTTLKREVREKWQKTNVFTHQVFGFEFNKKEINRYKALSMNHPQSLPIAPLIDLKMTKEDCVAVIVGAGIRIPEAYILGYNNNNCLKTGCVQGGIGYWKKLKKERPSVHDEMAELEHRLTDMRNSPVTMLRDQSESAKETGNFQVFLKKHPNYPHLKCLDDMKGREIKPLTDCNGFCGTNELNEITSTEMEINYDPDVYIVRSTDATL
jgi:3'-phosphoadenosine 5'-phosphosulfate sulfotransferase (PAPS reductase)/FAD synthetase